MVSLRNIILIFGLFIFNSTAAAGDNSTAAAGDQQGLTSRAAGVKDDGSSHACNKPCQNNAECTCKALESTSVKRETKCDNHLCTHCVKYNSKCSVGTVKNNEAIGGYFECCDGLLGSKNPREIECRGILTGATGTKYSHFKCIGPCDSGAYRFNKCVDKDGYYGTTHAGCHGSKPNTYQKCVKGLMRDCGAPGATCANDSDCCLSFECSGNKCKRTCPSLGEPCKLTREAGHTDIDCCSKPGGNIKCNNGKCQ